MGSASTYDAWVLAARNESSRAAVTRDAEAQCRLRRIVCDWDGVVWYGMQMKPCEGDRRLSIRTPHMEVVDDAHSRGEGTRTSAFSLQPPTW